MKKWVDSKKLQEKFLLSSTGAVLLNIKTIRRLTTRPPYTLRVIWYTYRHKMTFFYVENKNMYNTRFKNWLAHRNAVA